MKIRSISRFTSLSSLAFWAYGRNALLNPLMTMRLTSYGLRRNARAASAISSETVVADISRLSVLSVTRRPARK